MIGIFDSGYGGLTILKELQNRLPEYSYKYLGDNLNAPYGSRTEEEIYKLTLKNVEKLLETCELVILACNTASSNALRRIQQEVLPNKYLPKRVLGIIVPTIEQISQSNEETVAILGTEQTIKSRSYEQEISKINPNIKIVPKACTTLAHLIEQNAPEEEIDKALLKYLKEIKQQKDIDSILLGCTHYEIIAEQIKRHLKPETVTYKQPNIVASSLQDYLNRHPEIETKLDKSGNIEFLTTGNPNKVSKTASRFYGKPIKFKPTEQTANH